MKAGGAVHVTDRPAAVPGRPGLDARVPEHTASPWGWLPGLSLSTAVGVFMVAIADTAARFGQPHAETILWLGLLLAFAPVSARLFCEVLTRREGLGLVLILGLAIYVTKILHSPLGLNGTDEILHTRTLNDILATGHLFHVNPMLRVSAYYPGLEIVASAATSLSGLPFVMSATILLAFIRVILMLALFLLLAEVSKSVRVAALGSALYMGNQNFLTFSGYFAYESLALPLAITVLFLLARVERVHGGNRRSFLVLAFGTAAVIVVSHHLTTFALAAILIVWASAHVVRRMAREKWSGTPVATFAGLTLVGSAAWILLVAQPTVQYLLAPFRGAVTTLLKVYVRQHAAAHHLFRSSSGFSQPRWEQVVGISGTLLLLAALPLGLWCVWKYSRREPLSLTFALAALAYPLTLTLRFTGGTAWQIGNRASEFVFVPLSLVIATAIVKLWRRGRFGGTWIALGAMWMSFVFIGGCVTDEPHVLHMPGPYIAGANDRSIEPESINAALWSKSVLGSGRVVATDWSNGLLLSALARESVVQPTYGGIDPSFIFLTPKWSKGLEKYVRRGHVQYALVDTRFNRFTPYGLSYEGYAPALQQYNGGPIPVSVFRKFSQKRSIDRVFDSGNLQVYDVSRVGRRS